MFPKCSLDARNIATLRKHSANIPGILRAGWEMSVHVDGFMHVLICVQELARGTILRAQNQCTQTSNL